VVVSAAGRHSAPDTRAALGQLIGIYWFPLYAYVRRQGRPPAAAEDLVQEFLTRLLERNDLQHVDRAKGKFRSFLLACLKHFLANEHAKDTAIKRGGGQRVIALVRCALYMAAMSAIRYNPASRRFYQRLNSQGKLFKVAITACMRKLLVILNTLVRNDCLWQPQKA
jgi:DNA-directed RNA polymerase specialized sigma24 family protein